MSIITIEDVESVRFSAPDLAQMREFLQDFGMVEAEDTGDGILRMRGTSDAPFLHETVQGDPAYVSVTLRAASLSEVQSLAEAEGVPVEPAPGPGGGSQISLRDPDGFWSMSSRARRACPSLRAKPPPRGTPSPGATAPTSPSA
jgi:catechol 2,3-dioxygenase-like lactoylglutathione lyase family enzyme